MDQKLPTQQEFSPSKNLTPNPKPKRKISIAVVLVSLFILIATIQAIGTLYYLNINNANKQTNKTQANSPSPTLNPTSSWKSYTGEGFRIMYPNNWKQDPRYEVTRDYLRSPGGDPFILIKDLNIPIGSSREKSIYENIFTKDIIESAKKEYKLNSIKINSYDAFEINDIPLVDFYCNYKFLTEDNQHFIEIVFCTKNKLNSDIDKQILSTFKFTDQNSAVDTSDWKIHNSKTYTALYPQNWNVVKVKHPEQEPQNDEDSAFKSPDYEANLVPAITNGAEISIYKRVNTNNQKLESYIESKLAIPNKDNIKNLKKVNFGSNTYFNLFDCWEGCWDKYYLESGDSFYTITYQCTPNCNSESAIKNNKYLSVKNEFLKNFKLSN